MDEALESVRRELREAYATIADLREHLGTVKAHSEVHIATLSALHAECQQLRYYIARMEEASEQ